MEDEAQYTWDDLAHLATALDAITRANDLQLEILAGGIGK